jgi:hypothetical protein
VKGEAWDALNIGSMFASTPAALAKGLWEAAHGRSFEKGLESVYDPVQEACQKFGDDHHDHLNTAAKTVAKEVIKVVADDAYEHIKHRR